MPTLPTTATPQYLTLRSAFQAAAKHFALAHGCRPPSLGLVARVFGLNQSRASQVISGAVESRLDERSTLLFALNHLRGSDARTSPIYSPEWFSRSLQRTRLAWLEDQRLRAEAMNATAYAEQMEESLRLSGDAYAGRAEDHGAELIRPHDSDPRHRNTPPSVAPSTPEESV